MSDLISRADAIETVQNLMANEDEWYQEAFSKALKALPSAEYSKPLQTTLNGDLISKSDAIDGDLISRKVLMDRLESFCKWCKDGRLQGAEFVWDCIVPNVPSADAEPKRGCTANFVAEQLNKLEDMDIGKRIKLIQDLLGVEFKEENLNYEHATLVDIKEPLKVAVVRCKDCDRGFGSPVCPIQSQGWAINTDTFYCAWGERREP